MPGPAPVVLALGLAAAGCRVLERPLEPACVEPPPALPAALASPFAYVPALQPPAVRWEPLEQTDLYQHLRGRYTAPGLDAEAEVEITFELLLARRPGGTPHSGMAARPPREPAAGGLGGPAGAAPRRPLVCVMPILGGSYTIARWIARAVTERGWHAFFVHRIGDKAITGEEHPAELDRKLRATVVRVRRTLDLLLARPEVDPERVGLVGVSLGAIGGTVLLAVERRLGPGVLMMGGGDLPGMIAHSLEDSVRRLRVRLMDERGLDSLQALQAELRREITLDPLLFAPHVGARRVLQILTTRDNKVPTRYQWRLWEALGRPAALALPSGHYTAIVFWGTAERAMLDFLDRQWRAPAAPVPPAPGARPGLAAGDGGLRPSAAP
ncbi:MAG: hypothetical protein KatS3mg102_2508 [Planctomycetota bacterium]|nr:MAG: hypothetical protein KatS3mg102_2508 [Planctomycetota bacterium]